jgi:group I intron endonuclease
MTVVYQITNVANRKFYVGSSVKPRTRFQTHRRQLRKGTHHCEPLQRAWDKYGEDCFRFKVIEQLDSVEAMHAAEDKWLIEHQGQPHCYNVGTRAVAFFLGRTHTDEAKAKQSAGHAGMKHRLGHTNSPEHRARQSAAMRGIKKSPEHVEKIRQRMIGTSYAKGRVETAEMRAARGRAVIDVTSGRTFPSVRDAADHYGLERANVVRALRNDAPLKRGPRAGLHFRYACENPS